jgi:hypothetical protein
LDLSVIAADGMKVPVLPLLEVGRTVLVAAAPEDPPWRMVVDVVQDGQITLATVDDEQLPSEWHDISETHITTLDRFSVHLIHIPVLRVGDTRMVIGTPNAETPVQRRAYARITNFVPARCMLLNPEENVWIPFDAEVRDLGGGGLSLVAHVLAPEGATIALSIVLDGPPVVAMGKVLPREALPTIGRALIRVEFVLIREADRDRILRYVLLALAGRRHAQQLS